VVDTLGLEKDETLKASFQKSNNPGDFRHWIAQGLMKKLDVVPSRESSILGIAFSATNPDFAEKMANAFAQAYIRMANELKHRAAQQTADWFDGQLKILRERVEKAREELSSFQQTHGIVASTNERIDLEDAKLAELSTQLVKNQLQTDDLLSKKKQLTDALVDSESLESMNEVLSDPLLQNLKADLARSEAKFADLSIHVDKNHPQYRQTAAEIANLKKQVKAQTSTLLHGFNSSISSSKQRDDNLAKVVEKQKRNVLQLKKQHDEIAVLTREVANAQLAYDAVMQRSIQTRMESEIRQSNVAVLDKAVAPEKPDSPKPFLNMVLSLFLGVMAGVAAALFAEMMDRRVRTTSDITDVLDIPVFGVINTPQVSKKFIWSFGVDS
jgi:chain length determinant protein EpsF